MAVSIKIGVIGCGSISEFRHAPEDWANENAEIVAFYDPKRERAERLVKQYGGTAAKDFRDITQNPSIDAISDCSTNEMHHVISTDALGARQARAMRKTNGNHARRGSKDY